MAARFVTYGLLFAFLLRGAPAFAGEPEEAEQIVVSATRLPPAAGDEPFLAETLSYQDLQTAPTARLDEILLEVPGFTLFRRATSFSAHPTAQGAMLKGLSPNAASRALVVKDGIPLNDPFGGWVYWAALDPGSVGEVRITSGAGAGAWGSGALTGTVEITSRVPERAFEGEGEAGGLSTFAASPRLTVRDGDWFAVLTGGVFDTQGFHLVPASRRGPVDVPAASRYARAAALIGTEIGGGMSAQAHFSWFGEKRINGLELAANSTRALDAGVRVLEQAGPVTWEANLYGRTRAFASTFAAVNDARDEARQVLDQFDVPAREIGFNGRARFPLGAVKMEAGVDARFLRGFTNERFRNLGQGFTRLRTAGGAQRLAGVWLEAAHALTPSLALSARVRMDFWRVSDGVIREQSLEQPGLTLRDDAIAERAGVAPSARLGVRYRAGASAALFAAAYTGFRLPTLNELFRPFRVGNDITEANPALSPERVTGLEGGVELAPAGGLSLTLAAFHDWLEDGVGNVTIAEGPGVFPPAGFVPEGGTLRRRANIARISLPGLRVRALWRFHEALEVAAAYLYQRSRVARFPEMPELLGNVVILSPRHTFSVRAAWRPHEDVRLAAHLRYESAAFEDDRNTRAIPSALTVDLTARLRIGEHAHLEAALINALDEQVISRIAADGLLTLANPRRLLVTFGVGF